MAAGPSHLAPPLTAAVKLANGMSMPQLGFGTYQLEGDTCKAAVLHALRHGYRHIDTASVYRNEEQVGAAIVDSGVPRAEIFLVSKLQARDHGAGAYDACVASLARLGTGYLDLYLVHWPGVASHKLDDPAIKGIRKDTWLALQRLHAEGKCRAIGVSNYMPWHLDELCGADWCTVKPVVNQFELHPMLQQRDAVAACVKWDVRVEAYSSLARGKEELHKHPVVEAAAVAHGVTVGQVLLRWGLQKGYIIIPKSATPARIEENAKLFGWELTPEEMGQLDGLDGNLRTCWDPTTVIA